MKRIKSFLQNRFHTVNRLSLLVVCMSLLLISIACYGAWQVQRVQARSELLLISKMNGLQSVFELELQLQNLKFWLSQLQLKTIPESDKKHTEAHLQTLTNLRREIDHWIAKAEEHASAEHERQFLAKIHNGLSDFYKVIDDLPESEKVPEEQIRRFSRASEILTSEVLHSSHSMLNFDEEMIQSSLRRDAQSTRSLVQLVMVLGILGSIASLLAGYKIARTISNTLIQVQFPILDVAGKLSEVANPVLVSKSMDLTDLSPALEVLSAEVKSVVNQLQKRHQEILHAEQLATAGQLAAGIAHEIRNPLMSMKLLVQHAMRPNSKGIDAYDLQILDDEIRRLEMLLDDFLEFARPQILRRIVRDIRPLIEGTLGLLERVIEARNVEISYQRPEVPVFLYIDASRIKQVLLNLLLNAIQVTPPHGTVRLQLEQVQFEGQLACQLQIADDGPGLGDITEERLFEPFYSTKETGLGLGLPVSQRIIKQHGGEILLGPTNGGGAVFNIVIPFPDSALS